MSGQRQFYCYECHVWGPIGAIPHTERCSRYLPPKVAPIAPKCDCGSPDAHWQFCAVFVPYELS